MEVTFLKTRVADTLDLENVSIPGDKNSAHNMPLVWVNLLKENDWTLKLTNIYFKAAMGERNTVEVGTFTRQKHRFTQIRPSFTAS